MAAAKVCVEAFDVCVPLWANNHEKLAEIVGELQPKEAIDAINSDIGDIEIAIEKLQEYTRNFHQSRFL